VDNAHGAYLHFLEAPVHPLDLGADICCDSAHKTLRVLTGGAYLHIGKNAPAGFAENAKSAMALFGSTSPSYLIMASLDLCNAMLADNFSTRLTDCVENLNALRGELTKNGWQVESTDPLRITVNAPEGTTGQELACRLREQGIECEYADPEFLVFMATPCNSQEDFDRIAAALGINTAPPAVREPLPVAIGEQAVSIRQALFSPHKTIPAAEGLGRICASPTVSCPPAIPIAVSGEVIGTEAMTLFRHYGVETLDVLL
jgi:arginine/lysine/ornithine decarboxylase